MTSAGTPGSHAGRHGPVGSPWDSFERSGSSPILITSRRDGPSFRGRTGGWGAPDLSSFPRIGTSPCVVDRRRSGPEADPPLAPMFLRTLPETLERIAQTLGLGRTALARMLRVTRPPLYDWLNGKATPKGPNALRIAAIAQVLEEGTLRDPTPLFALFVEEPLGKGLPSLLACLQEERMNRTLALRLVRKAHALTLARNRRLAAFEALPGAFPSHPVDSGQRLDLNLTLAEWDRP